MTNASQVVRSAMGAHSTGDRACHQSSRKTFSEEVTPSRSEAGEVGGGRSVSGRDPPVQRLEVGEDTPGRNSEWLCVQ